MKSHKYRLRVTIALTVILLLLVAGPVSTALAYTAGPNDAGTGTNVEGAGSVDWVEPNAITSPGSPYAVATLNKDNRYSNYLQGTNYSFNLPINAIITGIEVVITHMSSGNNPSIYDNIVSLVKAGAILPDNKASLTPWLKGDFSTTTYGSSTDLWGTTWTPADINDPNFGVALAVYRPNQGNNLRDAIVDTMQITVYYALDTATTTVDCGTGAPITYGDSISCKATVTDAGTLTPTGTVSWTTDGSGIFDFTQCTLNEVTVGISTCSVNYTPTSIGTGTHLITANYGGDTNYSPSSGTDTVTINKKPASVTPNATSKTYGDLDPAFTGTLSGFLVGDGVTAAYSRTAGEIVSGSPYAISATLSPTAVLSNYDITYNTANFTITTRSITVTADAKTKGVGQPDPPLTFQVTSGSLAFSDAFSGSLTRDAGEAVGTYPIRQGSLALNDNYNLTFNGANLTITNIRIILPIIMR